MTVTIVTVVDSCFITRFHVISSSLFFVLFLLKNMQCTQRERAAAIVVEARRHWSSDSFLQLVAYTVLSLLQAQSLVEAQSLLQAQSLVEAQSLLQAQSLVEAQSLL